MTSISINLGKDEVLKLLGQVEGVEATIAQGVLANLMNDWVKPLLKHDVGKEAIKVLKAGLDKEVKEHIGTISNDYQSTVKLNPKIAAELQGWVDRVRREYLGMAEDAAKKAVDEFAERIGPAVEAAVSRHMDEAFRISVRTAVNDELAAIRKQLAPVLEEKRR